MDVISIGGLILGVLSSIAMFIKGIRTCRCTKRGLSLEREIKDDLERQQEFTINLIKLLQTYPIPEADRQCIPENEGKSTGGLSEISEELAPEIKEQMLKMLKILNTNDPNKDSNKDSNKSSPFGRRFRRFKHPKREEEIREEIRDEMRKSVEIELNRSRRQIKSNSRSERLRDQIRKEVDIQIKNKATHKPAGYRTPKIIRRSTKKTEGPKITQFITSKK